MFKSLIIFLFFFSIIFYAVMKYPIKRDVFNEKNEKFLNSLYKFPSEDLAEFKFQHAKKKEIYDIGLFGNSHVLMVRSKNIKFTNQEFFNFGIPGNSFRQSVSFLNELYFINKVPKVILIGIDHPEMGLAGEARFPFYSKFILNRIDDFKYLIFERNYNLKESIYFFINTFANFEYFLKKLYNIDNFYNKISIIYGLSQEEKSIHGYKIDGSGPEKIIKEVELKKNFKISEAQKLNRSEQYILLEKDLKKLSKITNTATHVIIFETLIEPEYLDIVENNLSFNASIVRERFFENCKKYNFICLKSKKLKKNNNFQWASIFYPPNIIIGDYLNKILDDEVIKK